MNAFCKPRLGVHGQVTKMLQAENGKKVDDFEPIYLDNYHEKWFTLSTTFGYRDEYDDKLMTMLKNTTTYVELKRDPTQKTERVVNQFV